MDHFAILGVGREATIEEIKSAFRKLAMEYHPDRVGHLEPAAQAEAANRMAEVNQAYSVLSNPQQRKEYEEELDHPPSAESVPQAAASAAAMAAAAAAAAAVAAAQPAAAKKSAARAPSTGNMARDFSLDLQQKLANAAGLKFEACPVEGFDWGLVCRTWMAQYLIASRAFSIADMASAQKFLRYAEAAINSRRRRKQYTLLVMPFEKMFESAKIAALFREFCNKQAGTVLIALLDMSRREKLICGPKPGDNRLLEVATGLRFPK